MIIKRIKLKGKLRVSSRSKKQLFYMFKGKSISKRTFVFIILWQIIIKLKSQNVRKKILTYSSLSSNI